MEADLWGIGYDNNNDFELYKLFFDRMKWNYKLDAEAQLFDVEVPYEDSGLMIIFLKGMEVLR